MTEYVVGKATPLSTQQVIDRLECEGRKFTTHDSGKRQDYESGMRRDLQDGKPRFDLIMPLDVPYDEQMLTRWAMLMERGRAKYGERNWEKADSDEELARFKQSALRHLMQWFHGVDDGEDHAAAVFFNVQCAEFVKWKQQRRST